MPDYMVLRNAAAVRTVSPFERLGPTAAAAPNVPEPRVEVHNVRENEAIDIARGRRLRLSASAWKSSQASK